MNPTPGWPPEWNARLGGANLLSRLLARRPAESSDLWLQNLESLYSTLSSPQCAPTKRVHWELCRAGLLYALDDLDGAHAVFQEIDSPEGSYWHGMLHRREGDFSNARYWVSRAGTVVALAGMDGFSPIHFIERCESAAKAQTDPQDLLDLQKREWDAMIHWSWLELSRNSR